MYMEKYILLSDSVLSNFFVPYNKLMFLESLLSKVLICSCHEIFSPNITPENLREVCLFKTLLAFFKSEIFKGSLFLLI